MVEVVRSKVFTGVPYKNTRPIYGILDTDKDGSKNSKETFMATEYTVVEARGWERSEWGQPTTEDPEFRTKGWGDPKTQYTEDNSE